MERDHQLILAKKERKYNRYPNRKQSLFGFLTFGVLLLQFTPSVDKEIVEMTGEWSQAYYLHLEIESDYLWTIQSCLLIHPATTKLTEIRMNGKKDRWLVFLFVCLFVWQRVRLTYCIFFVLKLHSVRKLSENHTNCELIVNVDESRNL